MAVETRYYVIRKGKELMSTLSKKEADEYDKMLENAERLFDFIQSKQDVSINEELCDKLTVMLAQNKDEVIALLSGKKARKPRKSTDSENDDTDISDLENNDEETEKTVDHLANSQEVEHTSFLERYA